MIVTVELLYGTQRKRERKREHRISLISYNIRCKGRRYKDVH
jgi:hypothetical protein